MRLTGEEDIFTVSLYPRADTSLRLSVDWRYVNMIHTTIESHFDSGIGFILVGLQQSETPENDYAAHMTCLAQSSHFHIDLRSNRFWVCLSVTLITTHFHHTMQYGPTDDRIVPPPGFFSLLLDPMRTHVF